VRPKLALEVVVNQDEKVGERKFGLAPFDLKKEVKH
jgi:hypothetical protein